MDAKNEAMNNTAAEETEARQDTADVKPVASESQPVADVGEPAAEPTEKAEQTEESAAAKSDESRGERPGASERGAAAPSAARRTGSGRKRVLVGRVVSDRMQKTIVVQIERRTLHPLYKKYITRSKKIKAHDESNECGIGDLVRVIESRPISKDKRWRLVEILERAK